jgi:hypothetical protein
LAAARDGVEEREKKRPRVLGGGAQHHYIGWKPETRTCPGHRSDMFGENYFGNSENFKNYLKI